MHIGGHFYGWIPLKLGKYKIANTKIWVIVLRSTVHKTFLLQFITYFTPVLKLLLRKELGQGSNTTNTRKNSN